MILSGFWLHCWNLYSYSIPGHDVYFFCREGNCKWQAQIYGYWSLMVLKPLHWHWCIWADCNWNKRRRSRFAIDGDQQKSLACSVKISLMAPPARRRSRAYQSGRSIPHRSVVGVSSCRILLSWLEALRYDLDFCLTSRWFKRRRVDFLGVEKVCGGKEVNWRMTIQGEVFYDSQPNANFGNFS